MAGVNVGDLTDSELRKKFKSLGQEVGPITKSTRGILEKKLKKLLSTDAPDASVEAKEKGQRKSIATSRSRRSSSVGRRASSARKSVTTTRFAPFSSDEDEPSSSIESNKKSVQTSPIGFIDVEPLAQSKKVVTTRARRKTLDSAQVAQPAILTNLTRQKVNINVAHAPEFIISNNRKSFPIHTSLNNSNNANAKNKTFKSNHQSEFSDDDFPLDTHYKYNDNKYFPTAKTPDNKKSVLSAANTQDSSRYVSGTFKPMSTTPNASHQHNTNQVLTDRKGSPSRFSGIDSPNVREEIDFSLHQIRKSFSAKKPSPTKDFNQFEIKRSNDGKVGEDEEEEEDEELDVEFAPQNYFGKFFGNKYTFITIGLVLLFFIFLGGLYFYNKVEDLPGISHAEGNLQIIYISLCLYVWQFLLFLFVCFLPEP